MPGFEEVKVEIASCLADIYLHANELEKCQQVIRRELETAHALSFWKCRFVFQLAAVYLKEKSVTNARQILQLGAKFCQENGLVHTDMLFRLSEGLVGGRRPVADPQLVLHDRTRLGDLRGILTSVGENIAAMPAGDYRRESLNAFYIFLQVAYMLLTGLVCGNGENHFENVSDELGGAGAQQPAAGVHVARAARPLRAVGADRVRVGRPRAPHRLRVHRDGRARHARRTGASSSSSCAAPSCRCRACIATSSAP